MRVEYIDNNGYIIETEKAVYVFDFVDGLLPATYFRKTKPLIFFVSNNNQEYYSEGIYSYKKTVIYAYDIPQDPYNKVFKVFPGEMIHLGFAKVFAEGTTRDGVTFIIQEDDKTMIHAGNLNNWHYQEFASEKRVEIETEHFLSCVKELEKYGDIDVLIFPVNSDVGYNYDHGAKRASRILKPKHFFPTQFRRTNNIEEFMNWTKGEDMTTYHFPKYNNQSFEVQND